MALWIMGHSRFATASNRRSNLQKCMGSNKAWHHELWCAVALLQPASAGQIQGAWQCMAPTG
eukprot:scaffold75802_cov21-Tisochrysis_lutea.AAC.1